MNTPSPSARASRLRRWSSARARELAGQVTRYAAVGGGATLVQLGIYAFIAAGIGAQPANVLSWLISTVVAGFAHHRFTFRLDHSGDERDHAVNLVSSLAALLLSSAVLAVAGNPAGVVGVVLLLAANGAVGTARFALLRWWLIGRRGTVDHPLDPAAPPAATTA